MKKFFIFCISFSVLIVVSALIYKFTRNDTIPTLAEEKPSVTSRGSFAWGVTTSSFQIDGYQKESTDKQIDVLKNLGVNTARITLERSINLDPFSVNYFEEQNDDFIKRLNEANIDVALIIDGDILGTMNKPDFNAEEEGYKMGFYAADRYKGKVKFIQIANEVTGTMMKPADPKFSGKTFEGDYKQVYSQERYDAVLSWLRGMSRGIRAGSPQTKIVVSGHWTSHFAISKLIQDGLDFDILGWAFYSSDGIDMTNRDIGEGQSINLVQKLKDIGKPLWIIETNTDKGSYTKNRRENGEKIQADFIRNFGTNIVNTKQFAGFFVFQLFDIPTFADNRADEEAHWGIIGVDKDKNGSPIYKKKEAFHAYKDLISKFVNLDSN